MNELKSCPFCGGKARWRYRKPIGWVMCKKCGASSATLSDNYEEADCQQEAITAWNRRVQLENKPLTLGELRQMDGEPVWCVDKKDKGKWALVHAREEMCVDADYGDWEFYSYGWLDSDVGWVAHKHKVV